MKTSESPLCPVCSARCATAPHQVFNSATAAAHFCPPVRDADRHRRLQQCIERLWGDTHAAVHYCPQCGFGFGWPYVGGDEEFYSIMHEMAGYPTWRWEFDHTINTVLPFRAPGRVLDIGAGFGGFLRRLDARWERHATEGSETTRQVLRESGIHCHADLGAATREAPGSFAVVTIFQVLEHLSAFREVLATCHALLQPGGVLVVAVPDAASTRAQEEMTGFPDMIPNHINKWTPQALDLAMRQAGLQPEPARHEPGNWSFTRYRALLRVKARSAMDSRSWASRAYTLRRKWVRLPVLAGLAVIEWVRLLPQWERMRAGRSFVMVARKP